MSSGFPGDFFTSGRSSINNTSSLPPNTMLMNNPGSSGYRTGFSGADRALGKRTLAEFQQQQQQHQSIPFNMNPAMRNHLIMQQQQQRQIQGEAASLGLGGGVNMNVGHALRSVKQRLYPNNASPISPLSPIDFSGAVLSDNSHAPFGLNHRFGLPIFQHLRHQQHHHQLQGVVNNCSSGFSRTNIINNNPTANGPIGGGGHCNLSSSGMNNNRVNSDESEKKTMSHKLQEIEKQLLLDDDDEDDVVRGNNTDDVSVLTGSEWSETVMNLVTPPPPNQSRNNSSPTTSSSSSSCSSSSTSASSKQSVMEAAAAISDGKLEVAAGVIARLSQLCSNNNSNSPEQRLLLHMCSALKLRLCPREGEEDKKQGEEALLFQLLSQHSVCFKFGYMAANFSIMEATAEATSLRIVDFNICLGGQYQNLIQLLSMRKSGKPSVVRITAVRLSGGTDEQMPESGIGDKLSQLGARLGIRVEFNAVALPDVALLSRDRLGCDEAEVLAVNLAYKLHEVPDESVTMDNPRDALLRRVKEMSPIVVTLVEQEMNCNTAPFAARVGECWSYYKALFESLESPGGWGWGEDADRIKVEEGLSRKMVNSVACEGMYRVERCEVFGKWRARMSMAGLKINPVSQPVVESLNNSNATGTRVGQGYFVKEECGGVLFGWMGRTLTVSSAWR